MNSTLDAPGRRGLLKALALGLGGALAAIASLPLVGAFLSPLIKRVKREQNPFLAVADLRELVVGSPKRVEFRRTAVDGWSRSEAVLGFAWLLKNKDESVVALSTVCPHSGCTIHLTSEAAFSCPCHASSFGLDGTPTSGPAPRAMDPLEVKVEGKQVLVRYARFRVGVKSREEI